MFKISPAGRFLTPFRIVAIVVGPRNCAPQFLSHHWYILESVVSKETQTLEEREREEGAFPATPGSKPTFSPFSWVLSSCYVFPVQVQALPASGDIWQLVYRLRAPVPAERGMMSDVALSYLYISKKISMLHSSLIGEDVGSSWDTLQAGLRKDRDEPLRK